MTALLFFILALSMMGSDSSDRPGPVEILYEDLSENVPFDSYPNDSGKELKIKFFGKNDEQIKVDQLSKCSSISSSGEVLDAELTRRINKGLDVVAVERNYGIRCSTALLFYRVQREQ